ncbi:MAG TPA: response regulator [Byssovorax sp.]|jgi:CheY-like chemotaxis protein
MSTTAAIARAETRPTALRVLVVDDNPDVLATISELVAVLGHDVTTASSGGEALAAAARSEPELVLLDIGLPDISGYEVARRLRQISGAPMRIVAVTGWGQESDRMRSAAAGFDLHLVKPIGVEALTDLLAARPRAAPTRDG